VTAFVSDAGAPKSCATPCSRKRVCLNWSAKYARDEEKREANVFPVPWGEAIDRSLAQSQRAKRKS